jgi:hypothetical protein
MVALFVASDATAQQAEVVQPKYSGSWVILNEVPPVHLQEYQAWFVKYAAAEKKRENPNFFACYTAMTGGPSQKFWWVYPMEKLSDMEEWTHPAQVMISAYPAEEWRRFFKEVNAMTGGASDWLSGNVASLSNLDPDKLGHFYKYGYYMHIKVKPGFGGEYNAVVRKIVAAHKKNPRGVHWGLATWGVGRSYGGPEYGAFFGFDEFAELDEWPFGPELLIEEYGQEGAAEIMNTLGEITDTVSYFVQLVPELSNLPE